MISTRSLRSSTLFSGAISFVRGKGLKPLRGGGKEDALEVGQKTKTEVPSEPPASAKVVT